MWEAADLLALGPLWGPRRAWRERGRLLEGDLRAVFEAAEDEPYPKEDLE